MATLTFLRLSKGAALSRTFGQHVLTRSSPVGGAMVQHKTFMLSPIARKRLYGPQEEHEKHDELGMWRNERIVAVSLIPLIPTAILFPNMVLDMALCSAMVVHSHWRLTGVTQDYIHGEVLPKIAKYTVLILSICAFGSLTYFNYADIGFANAARMIFSQL